jgi:hypothetical protein
MSRAATIVGGAVIILVVTFANPLAGNVLGFCPISEGPKAVGIDAAVAAIDGLAGWLIYRGLRS